ncbi:hypothetical protein OIU78_018464, partial [Salix suchowensis]
MPPKRKKWTEVEEKTLIEKYGEMVSDGTLAKMKTREKKYKPIALYVNSAHHVRDPIAYPWQWTWKDVSTKVQNMRHQYMLVKQKIKKPDFSSMDNSGCSGGECSGNGDEFDWLEGRTHWSNFLLYKEVFGDLPVAYGTNGSNCNDLMGVLNEENCNGNDRAREDGDDGFVYEEMEPNVSNLRKKRKALKGFQKRVFGFLSNQLGQLRDMEARFEQRELERERERQGRENVLVEREQEWERKLET